MNQIIWTALNQNLHADLGNVHLRLSKRVVSSEKRALLELLTDNGWTLIEDVAIKDGWDDEAVEHIKKVAEMIYLKPAPAEDPWVEVLDGHFTALLDGTTVVEIVLFFSFVRLGITASHYRHYFDIQFDPQCKPASSAEAIVKAKEYFGRVYAGRITKV